MADACWIFGSDSAWTDQDMTFGGGTLSGTETITASLTGLYLHHSTAALSLLEQVKTAITNAGGTNAYARMNRNRKVQIGADESFSVTWVDTNMRDVLGYTGNLGSATSHEATNVSEYFWSPARYVNPMEAPLGAEGQEWHDAAALQAPGGTTTVTRQATSTFLDNWLIHAIPKARFQTTQAGLGGELKAFHSKVLVKGAKFVILGIDANRSDVVDEDDSSSAAATLTIANALGPYVINSRERNWQTLDMKRTIAGVDSLFEYTLPVMKSPEYT